jgi:alkylation response protein AidB-like acyl-CoA dehydrogenase
VTHAGWAVLGARIELESERPHAGGHHDAGGHDSDNGDDDAGTGGDRSAVASGPVRWMLVPAADMTVIETWNDAAAMRGTGSHTVELVDAFVPEELAHSWSHPLRIDRPLYHLGRTSVTGSGSAAIALGVLRSAIAELTGLLSGYRSALDGAAPRDWANVQHTVAELSAARRAAKAGLVEAAEEVWAAAEAPGGDVPVRLRAELFAAADHAVQVALAGVSRAFVCGTGRALQQGHPLEQALRDVHGMAINWERVRRMVYDAGRVLLGQEPRYRAM